MPLETNVIRLGWSEGSEVMRSDKRSGTLLEALVVDALWPPQGALSLEGAWRRAGEHPVAIGA